MRKEYDFSKGKCAGEVPHLAKLQAETGKSRITFRERAEHSGKGYQTLINEALRDSLSAEPLTVETLRKILHEEMRVA
jgi:hypothetical protein